MRKLRLESDLLHEAFASLYIPTAAVKAPTLKTLNYAARPMQGLV